MALPSADIATAHWAERRSLTLEVLRVAALWWAYLRPRDLDNTWPQVRTGLDALLTAAQFNAAGQAERYVSAVLNDLGVPFDGRARLNPQGFSGTTEDGRPIATMLDTAPVKMRIAVAGGMTEREALDVGRHVVERQLVTELADAGRSADHAALGTQSSVTGYYRRLQLPSCSRCVILAGKWYRWNAGFRRHERCDCLAVPAVEPRKDLEGRPELDPQEAVDRDLVTDLTKAEKQALADGADLSSLVNAHRSTTIPGTRTKRLTVADCYRRAGGDRDRALQLLAANRYIVTTST